MQILYKAWLSFDKQVANIKSKDEREIRIHCGVDIKED